MYSNLNPNSVDFGIMESSKNVQTQLPNLVTKIISSPIMRLLFQYTNLYTNILLHDEMIKKKSFVKFIILSLDKLKGLTLPT